MNKNPLIQYYLEQYHTFKLNFRNTLKNQDIENIHQLRVSIKKLRALWALMEDIGDGGWEKGKHQALVSTIFKPAGNLREAQVNYELIKKSKAKYLQHYLQYLLEQQDIYKTLLVGTMKNFDLKQMDNLNKELINNLQNVSNNSILKSSMHYLNGIMSKVNEYRKDLPNDDILHKIRIKLKKAVEVLAIIRSVKPRSGLAPFSRKIKSINSKIGRWHDAVILNESLKRFFENNTDYGRHQFIGNRINRSTKEQLEKQAYIQTILPDYLVSEKILN